MQSWRIVSLSMCLTFLTTTLLSQKGDDLVGRWRGEFTMQDTVRVPFNFEVDKDGRVTLLNASERYETGILAVKHDSVFIPLDQFDNELALQWRRGFLQGVLRKQDRTAVLASLLAEKGKNYRFANNDIPPARDISGKYEVNFTSASGNVEKAVGIFTQNGSQLTGTFLKPSGDTRFLEGTVEGDSFYLSSFIGSTPGYYYGSVSDSGVLKGEQVGTRVRYALSGRLNANAQPEAAKQKLSGNVVFSFSLPDSTGRTITLNDEKYRNKVVIVAVTGTWCPNCIDEARFLSPWYLANRDRGVEIVLVHFERQADTAYANKMMSRFRSRFKITYDQVFGGLPVKENVLKALPALTDFSAYPTTVILDRKHRISSVHKGFSGPATGKYYDDFVKEFNEEVDRLLTETEKGK